MAQLMTINLSKGESPNLGFRLQGGKDFAAPLVIQKVNGGSPAERSGLIAGDAVIKINNTDVFNLRHKDAQDVIVRAGPSFSITVQRGGSTWKPTVTPTGAAVPQPSANFVSPVTKTSLAAKHQTSIDAIGTGHNVAAKPFLNGTSNGGPKVVNKQYNTPIGLYSEQSIAETLSAQSEVLSTGALGVNFKKNEKNYDASKSAVYSMLQEAEKEPREIESEYIGEPSCGIVPAPQGGFGGLRHVVAPENKPAPPTPQLPPGQNICADCERLIVGVFVRIKDKNLHVECFKCSTCGASLKNVGYYNINNKLYCDVHAKLAAKSNPPGPNLVPVTLPPGRAPASAISAALSTHNFPTPAPLSPLAGPISPSTNLTAAPFQPSETVPKTELDYNDNHTDIDTKLLKSLTLAAARKSDAKLVTAKNPNSELTKLSNGVLRPAPVPYSQYVNKAGFSSAPRPFSSVNAPLSPNSYGRPLPKTPYSAPAPAPVPVLAPAPISTPGFSTAKPGGGVSKESERPPHSIIWPPLPDELELPTASPLYFPPPSQVQVHELSREEIEERLNVCECVDQFERDYTELEEFSESIRMDPRMSLCSTEVCSITGRRSAVECAETISEHLETQMLVDSIVKTRPKSPPPLDTDIVPSVKKQPESKKEISSVCAQPCNKSCCNEKCETCPLREPAELKRPADYQKHEAECRRVQNLTPQPWESSMVKALSTAPEGADPFKRIPQKHSSSAFASALAIAPSEPFNPVPAGYTTRDPVPLPEETVPYFPPEHPIIPAEPKPPKQEIEKPTTPFVEALKIAPDRPFTPVGGTAPVKKKKPQPDPYLSDLPKPTEKLTMLAALTTAPTRCYSPLEPALLKMQEDEKRQAEEELRIKTAEEERRRACIKQPSAPKPFISSMVTTFEGGPEIAGNPNFPPVSMELQQSASYHADYEHIKQELHSQSVEQQSQQVCEKRVESQMVESQQMASKQVVIAKQDEEVILKKPVNYGSTLHKSQQLPSYQQTLQYDEELQLPHHKNINKLLQANTKSKVVPDTRPLLRAEAQHMQTPPPQIIKPVTTVQPGWGNPVPHQSVFQPVHDDFQPPNSAFSQRVSQPATPSLINKPPSAIPYYQQNLVATEFLAPEINVFDPKSPGVSRSPSPCPGMERSVSPFRKSSPRPKSPAPGPPPNPLQRQPSEKRVTYQDLNIERAKESLSTYIPQHKEKLQGMMTREMDTASYQTAPQNYAAQGASQNYPVPQNVPKNYAASQNAPQNYAVSQKGHSESMSAVSQGNYQRQDYQAQSFLEEQARRQQVTQQGDMRISRKEEEKLQQQQALNKSQEQSVERSGNVQIQRKKTVTEEYEHTHKEKTIEIEKGSVKTPQHPFKNVNVPVIEEHGIIGLHVTNPHQLNSPFLQQRQQPQQQCTKAAAYTTQAKPQPPPPKVQVQPPPPKQPVPVPTKITAPVPPLTTPVSNQSGNPPAPSVVGSGRQAGGSVFAPKRGRGVLNVGGLAGARIALCGSCHQQIRGPFITALGKIWCPEHFTCATPSCKRPLQDIGFVEERGQLHCEYCFEQYLAPNCSKCNAKIKGDCLKAIGKNFHPECFNCAYCGKLFANSPFFLEDGLPYCETDWNEMFTTKCFACGFPVEAGDRWVEALNNNYHSQCFNCTMCKKNLEGQSFFAKGGRPFCKNHAR